MPGQDIAKPELFARLAEGHAAGITVVTPNRRLAQVLKSEFDSFQANKNLAVWEDADILPVGAFIERLYEDALYASGAADLPQLLTAAQERAMWESVLDGSLLLSVSETAGDCAKAWHLAHEWRIAGALDKFAGNEDTQTFAGWAREYAKRCAKQGLVDSARLPDLRLEGKRPKILVAYAFNVLPPQTRDFLKQFEVFTCGPEKKTSKACRSAFPSARHELEAAARWARARLERGGKRIGVVVPDVETRRKEVARVFSGVMRSDWNVPGADHRAMPFEISFSEPLSNCPVVDFALGVLEFSIHEIEFARASHLIRSPFFGDAEDELAARARIDVRLREKLGKMVPLPKLISEVEACPLLRSCLEKLFLVAKKRTESSSPHDWARHFTVSLDAVGFPGQRPLDSEEFQAYAKFNEALAEFSHFGILSEKISFQQAVRHLRRICADTAFQPETPEVPIRVLGVLESADLEFDHLWVSGLSDEVWPRAVRPNPFLPIALQRKAEISQASAEASLAFDRGITTGWLGAAEEVVFSYPEKEKDRDLLPSPLIAQIPEGKVDLPSFATYRDVLFSSRVLETVEDGKAPELNSKTVKGGTRILTDQAACPFRAFARHRLAAEGLDAPSEGLDAMQRGNLLHALMAGIWKELGSSASLSEDLNPVIEKAAESAVKELEIEVRFAEFEKQRLIRLAGDWLEIERQRKPFEVVQIEQKRPLVIGGLSFNGRIDRMDRLADGTHALIDYKTGSRVTPNDWMGERPDEPQLPLYAVTAEENVSAVAFAKLKTGDMKFSGFSVHEKEIPGVRAAQSWGGLMATWTRELESLASGYAQGDARVDPKKGLQTCRYCDLQPLCRVHERLNALDENEEEGRE
jgi:ATP-dependent helicase/nuclease subunit B